MEDWVVEGGEGLGTPSIVQCAATEITFLHVMHMRSEPCNSQSLIWKWCALGPGLCVAGRRGGGGNRIFWIIGGCSAVLVSIKLRGHMILSLDDSHTFRSCSISLLRGKAAFAASISKSGPKCFRSWSAWKTTRLCVRWKDCWPCKDSYVTKKTSLKRKKERWVSDALIVAHDGFPPSSK